MTDFLSILSNREKATALWLLIIFVAMLFSKSIRKSLADVLKMLFKKSIIIILLSITSYILLIVSVLLVLGFWDISLLKDTILWSLGAFIITININKVKNLDYFIDVIKDTIKFTIILEFIVAFYSFSFIKELLLIPIVTFASAIQITSKYNEKHKDIGNLASKFISLIGLVVFLYVSFKTYTQYKDLITISQLKTFLLPILLTLLFFPFIYGFALYTIYEVLFIRMRFIIKDEILRKKVIKQILKIANINLNKLTNISQNINRAQIINSESLADTIKELSKNEDSKQIPNKSE